MWFGLAMTLCQKRRPAPTETLTSPVGAGLQGWHGFYAIQTHFCQCFTPP